MKSIYFLILLCLPSIIFADAFIPDQSCCATMGCVGYCDSSSGRFVCTNGEYSACYCTRHAAMDLQNVQGCCTWQGGVLKIDRRSGLVICNNGGVSEFCSGGNQIPNEETVVSLW